MKKNIVFVASFVAFGIQAALPVACTSDTTGERVALEVHVAGANPATTTFTNAYGWNVTLSKALLSIGPLYYYDGPPIFSDARPTIFEWLHNAFVERSAFAHPGHYVPGNALGEFLGASSVDLRTTTVLGMGDGVSGTVRSATFTFQAPAVGPFANALGTHVAVFEGVAQNGADTRPFRAEIDEADILNADNAPTVEGCPFAEVDIEADGVVTLTIGIAEWFDQVEFDSIPASEDGTPVLMPDGAIGRNELVRGMKEGLGYSFTYAPK
ncbi:MAG: hypothetical protein FWD69_16440 [Polyangiaceae bacterium]|nr:hypothetical protein [Polyangiaceae bacterium]